MSKLSQEYRDLPLAGKIRAELGGLWEIVGAIWVTFALPIVSMMVIVDLCRRPFVLVLAIGLVVFRKHLTGKR